MGKRRGTPTPSEVRTARFITKLTMAEAASLVYSSRSEWLAWETDEGKPKHKDMHPALAELFALKTGLAPLPSITRRLEEWKFRDRLF